MLKKEKLETLTMDEFLNIEEPKKKTKKKNINFKLPKKAIIAILAISLVLLTTSLIIFFTRGKKPTSIIKRNTVEPNDVEENYSFSFIGVGDALIHGYLYIDAQTGRYGSDGYQIYDFSHMFTYLKDVVKDYDLKYYNQETIIGGKNLGLSGYPAFNSPDEIGNAMLDAGFNVVSLATNHTMDKGLAGINYSLNYWKNKKAVVIGSYSSWEERNTIPTYEVNGISYAILNYTYGTNGIAVPAGHEYVVNVWPTNNWSSYENYKAQVKKDVDQVRDKVDVVMVAMHWGEEYQVGTYNSYQQDAANYLSSIGVNVIIGTHPHVVQPVEYINDTLVIYSLGNLISNQRYSQGIKGAIGGIAAFTVNKTVKDGEVSVSVDDAKIDLLYTYDLNHRNYQAIPFTKLNDSLLYNYRSIYDQYKSYLNPKGDQRIQVGFIN